MNPVGTAAGSTTATWLARATPPAPTAAAAETSAKARLIACAPPPLVIVAGVPDNPSPAQRSQSGALWNRPNGADRASIWRLPFFAGRNSGAAGPPNRLSCLKHQRHADAGTGRRRRALL